MLFVPQGPLYTSRINMAAGHSESCPGTVIVPGPFNKQTRKGDSAKILYSSRDIVRVTMSRAQLHKKPRCEFIHIPWFFVKLYTTNVVTPSNLLRGDKLDSYTAWTDPRQAVQ